MVEKRERKLKKRPLKVLYSFPHKLGAERICYTAWQQCKGLAAAGAKLLIMPGVLHRPVASDVLVQPTLAYGPLRISYRLLGRIRSCALHDAVVARRLEKLADQIDIIHTWPLGAEKTLRTAKRIGIPTVLERPNAHTRYAYTVVREECHKLGLNLPPDHEHAYNSVILQKEETEYKLADGLLCPSEFVIKTFLDQGFLREKLIRHFYGVDEKKFYPLNKLDDKNRGLTIISVGVVAVRKGQHYALEAWLKSSACQKGTFLIAGQVLPEYKKILAPMLSHPSVKILGHRNDVPELLRQSDVFVLSSIEEGFALVCTEAMASGAVPLVSEACTDLCIHMENALVHRIGDVNQLAEHISLIDRDRSLLSRLRENGLKKVPEITWNKAGERLIEAYCEVIDRYYENSQKYRF